MPYSRDPVSVPWDKAAASLLLRAVQARGAWVATRIKDPTDRQVNLYRSAGIYVLGRDNAATLSGKRANYRTRWCRGFARAFYRLKGARAVELEVGAHKPASGVIPAGRAVRARVRRGGSVARRAVQRKADDDRIFDDEGFPAGRWSDPEGRDW